MEAIAWFVKSRRAASVDDYETWNEGGVTPTLNAFDNATETRATVLVFPIQSTVIGRADHNGPQGKGYGLATDPMFTIDRVGAHGVAITEGHDMDEQKAALVRMRAGKEGGGKGALVSEERSLTLATSNDQTPFVSTSEPLAVDLYNNTLSTTNQSLRSAASDVSKYGTVLSTVAPTLSASNNPSRSPQSSEITAQVEAVVKATSTVRRLTPVECERLQGFPDGWTDGQADSHRYKQMGNAVTVNVAEVVGRFIMAAVADNA